jgi:hypothetical protein
VAAELSRLGFIVSPTSRSAYGADLLVTDHNCSNAFSVQVKSNATTFSFWLLNERAKQLKSSSHLYVFVNLRKQEQEIEYFVVPSRIVADKMRVDRSSKKGRTSTWYSFSYKDALPYKNKWSLFENWE